MFVIEALILLTFPAIVANELERELDALIAKDEVVANELDIVKELVTALEEETAKDEVVANELDIANELVTALELDTANEADNILFASNGPYTFDAVM